MGPRKLVRKAPAETRASAGLARSAADLAEQMLCDFAEQVVQILIEMGSPGSKFLDLTQ